MSSIIGILATGITIIVLVIAAGSLLFVGCLPIAQFRARRRARNLNDD